MSLRTVTFLGPGVSVFKRYGDGTAILSCWHDPGYRRDHEGEATDLCRSCKGTSATTEGWTQPVKMLVVLAVPREDKVPGTLF